MKVFCVLFLVLLNTIGNQGDPKHGLIAPGAVTGELKMNIVSMRNDANCHICTGSIISRQLILSSLSCVGASHFLHGFREYENCTEIEEGNYRIITVMNGVADTLPKEEGWKTRPKCKHESVEKEFGLSIEKLLIPQLPNSKLSTTGAVLGWSFDNNKRKFVMKKTASINIRWALSNKTTETFFQELCEVGTGSPLISTRVIYGFLSCSRPYRFDNILADVELIKSMIKNYS